MAPQPYNRNIKNVMMLTMGKDVIRCVPRKLEALGSRILDLDKTHKLETGPNTPLGLCSDFTILGRSFFPYPKYGDLFIRPAPPPPTHPILPIVLFLSSHAIRYKMP